MTSESTPVMIQSTGEWPQRSPHTNQRRAGQLTVDTSFLFFILNQYLFLIDGNPHQRFKQSFTEANAQGVPCITLNLPSLQLVIYLNLIFSSEKAKRGRKWGDQFFCCSV